MCNLCMRTNCKWKHTQSHVCETKVSSSPADVTNAFQISHASKSFHVCALSSADKTNWLTNLQKHIDRVAQSGKAYSGSQTLLSIWEPDLVSPCW